MSVGIPRALFAFKQPRLWPSFLRALNVPYCLSPYTNAPVLARGVTRSDGETCLSCKVFVGHCAWLVEHGVDALLVPRYKSLARGYHCCPKFYGLPDIARVLFPGVDIVAPTVDLNRWPLTPALALHGVRLGAGHGTALRAARTAVALEQRARSRSTVSYSRHVRAPLPIALVAHPYTLHDQYVNMNIARRLSDLGASPVPVDAAPPDPSADPPDFGWDFARTLYAQTATLVADGVQGIIQLSTCNCGCDAVIAEYVQALCRASRVPYTSLVLDEHTSDGGLQTRVEAFVDTLVARERFHVACD